MIHKNVRALKDRKSYAYASLGIFLISLMLAAFSVNDMYEVKTFSGIKAFIFGAVGLLGGGFFEWLIWLANFFYFLSLGKGLSGKRNGLLFNCLGIIIASTFVFWRNVLVGENGRMGTIHSLEIGYFAWLASMVIWSIGILSNKLTNQASLTRDDS